MKVLHVCPSLNPGWGGPASVVSNLTQNLLNLGVECTVFTTIGPRVGKERVQPSGIHTEWYPVSAVGGAWTGFSIPLLGNLRKQVDGFDVVHVHELWHFPHWAAVSTAQLNGVPVVITPHGQLAPWALQHHKWKKLAFGWHHQKSALRKAAAVQALSDEEATQISSFSAARRVAIIPNGIDESSVIDASSYQERLRQRSGRPDRPQTVLFLGRLHPQKNLGLLLKAFAIVSRSVPLARLLIVGPDEHKLGAELSRMSRQLGISDNVSIPGPAYGAEKSAVFNAADVFVLPSRFEGQSVALLEAMAAGLPVVVTTAANSPDVAAADAGIVVQAEPTTLAAAIVDLLCNTVDAQRKGRNARDFVAGKFTWPSISASVLELYTGIMEARAER